MNKSKKKTNEKVLFSQLKIKFIVKLNNRIFYFNDILVCEKYFFFFYNS